jgi:ferredoxin
MPKLKRQGKEIELKEGENIAQAAEELGIAFSCYDGLCGMCVSIIKSGKENLPPLTEQEQDLGMSSNRRLACQCKILKGEVELE